MKIKFNITIIIFFVLFNCVQDSNEIKQDTTIFKIITFDCSETIDFIVIENNHVIVKRINNDKTYIYKLETDEENFVSILTGYKNEQCSGWVSIGKYINNYADGLLTYEKDYLILKNSLEYCKIYGCD